MIDLNTATDTEIADDLAQWWKTRIAEDGTRETYDPNAGLWFNDADLASNYKARTAARSVFGDRLSGGMGVARDMNRMGL